MRTGGKAVARRALQLRLNLDRAVMTTLDRFRRDRLFVDAYDDAWRESKDGGHERAPAEALVLTGCVWLVVAVLIGTVGASLAGPADLAPRAVGPLTGAAVGFALALGLPNLLLGRQVQDHNGGLTATLLAVLPLGCALLLR